MKQRIMVIEDEKGIADAIVYAMKREGFAAEAAYDGEEALKKFDLFKPDAIILDIMLPGINGFEVLKRLESRKSLTYLLKLAIRVSVCL